MKGGASRCVFVHAKGGDAPPKKHKKQHSSLRTRELMHVLWDKIEYQEEKLLSSQEEDKIS